MCFVDRSHTHTVSMTLQQKETRGANDCLSCVYCTCRTSGWCLLLHVPATASGACGIIMQRLDTWPSCSSLTMRGSWVSFLQGTAERWNFARTHQRPNYDVES